MNDACLYRCKLLPFLHHSLTLFHILILLLHSRVASASPTFSTYTHLPHFVTGCQSEYHPLVSRIYFNPYSSPCIAQHAQTFLHSIQSTPESIQLYLHFSLPNNNYPHVHSTILSQCCPKSSSRYPSWLPSPLDPSTDLVMLNTLDTPKTQLDQILLLSPSSTMPSFNPELNYPQVRNSLDAIKTNLLGKRSTRMERGSGS